MKNLRKAADTIAVLIKKIECKPNCNFCRVCFSVIGILLAMLTGLLAYAILLSF